ncbi:MAG: hypothetical protein ACKVIY_17795, partial [Acidimicrobiales bacterium]
KVHASHGFGTGHAFRAIAAYEDWLADDSEESRRELAVLRLLGLFDRPATADCVQALRKSPTIDGLTDPLVGLPPEDWEFTLTTLSDARLVSVNRDEATGELVSLDAHPLIREYFALQLCRPDQSQRRSGNDETDDHAGAGASSLRSSIRPTETSEVWRAAHRRLYEHLCETTKEGDQPTLEDLQPLYQAVAHGCHAGLQQEAWNDVFNGRVIRRNEKYSKRKLGAFGSDLGAIACFYEQPWNCVAKMLTEDVKSLLFDEAGFSLRALGRLTESLEPMRSATETAASNEDRKNAAAGASNLSELELTLGEVSGALSDAERSVTYADLSGDSFQRMAARKTHADALYQSGRRSEAESLFRKAEQMQADEQPDYPLLYSVQGFQYCDLLLAPAEREAWRKSLELSAQSPEQDTGQPPLSLDSGPSSLDSQEACRAVTDRAKKMFEWQVPSDSLLDIALDHLTLSRAALCESLLSGSAISPSASPLSAQSSEIEAAVSALRRAGTMDQLPRGLLTRAWQWSLLGRKTGQDSAQSDLDEA